MKYTFLLIAALLFAATSFGKGHGGHGGEHHGGAHHSGAHYGGGQSTMRAAPNNERSTARPAQATTTSRNTARTLLPSPVAVRRGEPVSYAGAGTISAVHPGYYGYTFEHPYNVYGYGYGYGYSPFFYDPYFSMFSFGMGMMYTPHYNYVGQGNNGNNNNDIDNQVMYGYVVYAHDTIRGLITLKPNAVLIQNVDSGRNYDYKFRLKKSNLEFINVYNNSDSSQLCLTRVKSDKKKMWRIVHEGRLNVYDQRMGFIYRPEDIDARTLMVMGADGVPVPIGSSSKGDTKLRLTDFVNKAYGLGLDPDKYSWKELLIYVDKLD